MLTVVGIQFKGMGRIYFFDPLDNNYNPGDFVVVETVRGFELGKVIVGNHEIEEKKIESELKPVIRLANDEDINQEEENNVLAVDAFKFFRNAVEELNLEMKPLYAEYTIDRTKVIFYYTSEDRVDFRELLRMLTPEFKIRVELRQIGPREAARVIGGLGSCGKPLCCSVYLKTFDIVTMKMAKDQAMSLNTTKISGACGKLMCCIAYENQLYQELRKEVPAVGSMVKIPNGSICKVVAVDYIKKTVRVVVPNDIIATTLPVSDIKVVSKNEANDGNN